MNLADITKLRNLLGAAPPTPWVVEEREGWWEVAPANPSARLWPPMAFDDGSACGEYSARCLVKSRDLIVAAVNALPELLDEIERLRARVGWLDHLDTPRGRAMHATEAVKIENEELKASLKEASKLLGGLASVCNYAHHGKHDRHSLAEQCPVEKRIDILLEKIKECIS